MRILAVMSNVKRAFHITAAVVLLGTAAAPKDVHAGSARIFAPGVISGPANDGSPSFSPDGKTLLFTRSGSGAGIILESHLVNGLWTSPAIAAFSGVWNDQHPSFSPDGSYVVFVSTRPAPQTSQHVAHIWKVARTSNGWGTPQHLPSSVNFGRWMFAPSVAADGTIYYLSIGRTGTKRTFQLYRARSVSGAYQPAEKLPFSSPRTADVDPEIASDQSFLVFASSGRRPGDTNEHLYIVRRNGAAWGDPQALRYDGDDANGGSNDNEPRIGRDGHTLFFASDRTLKIDVPRTRPQAEEELSRIQVWDDGDTNVWSIILQTRPPK